MTMPRPHAAGRASALGFALLLAGGPVLAQAPASPPPPPAPQRAAARAPDTMPRPVPPPRVAARAPAAAQTAAAAAARPAPPPRAGLPPDSVVRTASRPAPETAPAGAVARCRDGTFIVAPSDPSACAAHRGVGVVFPQRGTPPPAATRPPPSGSVSRPAATASATPPAGATMRCRDGTWLTGAPSEGRCAANGGTAVVLPAARPTPPAPRPRRP